MTVWHRHEVHLLAYFIDPDDAAFARLLEVRSASRRDRVREIAARLETLGAPIDADAVLAACKDGNVGRPHLARALIAAGHCHDANEAFDRFLGREGRAYVPASHLPIAEAMDAVHQAGGVAVLAHPGVEKIDESLPELAGLGLDGLEAHHPAHGFADTARYLGVCQLYGLKATGGADFHGHPGAAPPGGGPRLAMAALRDRCGLSARRGIHMEMILLTARISSFSQSLAINGSPESERAS